MKNGTLEIITRLSAEDFKRVMFQRQKVRLIILAVVDFLFIGFIALGLTAVLLSKKNNFPLINLIPLLIPIFIFSLPLVLLIWATLKQSRRLAESAEETKYVFNEQGMETESASTAVKILWTKFYKIVETITDFLLYTQKNIAVPIPKRFFESENQMTDFRNLIKLKVAEKARLKN